MYVDNATNRTVRIIAEADSIPADFPVHSATTTLDYDFVDISGKTFLLPLKSTTLMSADDYMTRNDTEFRIYRKYSAESEIKFDVNDIPAPLPDDKTKETTDTKAPPGK